MDKFKRVLLFDINNATYSSYRYFMSKKAEELSLSGTEVIICKVPSNKASGIDLDALGPALDEAMSKHPEAALDFNSLLPNLIVDGAPLPKALNIPFYDWILDHPLYHHRVLSRMGDFDAHLICVDEDHARYARENYPKIKEVLFSPLPGYRGAAADLPFKEKEDKIFFAGTLEDSNLYLEAINSMPEDIAQMCHRVMEECIYRGPETPTMEQVIKANLKDKSELKLMMHACFGAEMYIRNEKRKELLQKLLNSNIPLSLYGRGFESLENNNKNAAIFGPVDYKTYVDLCGKYRVNLNILPGFTAGPHDRVTNALANGCIALTDSNRYIDKLSDSKIVTYDSYNLLDACNRALNLNRE